MELLSLSLGCTEVKPHFSRALVGLDLLFAAQQGFFSWFLVGLNSDSSLLAVVGGSPQPSFGVAPAGSTLWLPLKSIPLGMSGSTAGRTCGNTPMFGDSDLKRSNPPCQAACPLAPSSSRHCGSCSSCQAPGTTAAAF